jgi:hypothetical protein
VARAEWIRVIALSSAFGHAWRIAELNVGVDSSRRRNPVAEVVPGVVEVEAAIARPVACRVVGCRATAKLLTRRDRHAEGDAARLRRPAAAEPARAGHYDARQLAGAPARGLLALAMATGLQVMQTLMDEDVARLVGPRGGNPCTTVSLQQKFVALSLRSVRETGSR